MSGLEWLGRGKFGNVWGKCDVALKVVKIPMDRPSWHDELIREAIVCGQIKFFQSQEVSGSDKVIRFLGASLEIKDSQYIFRLEMSRAHGGSLLDAISNPGFKLSPGIIETYVSDLKAGLTFCHAICGILVRDISPGNVLIPNADDMHFVLADFGKARPMTDNLVNVEYSEGYHGAPVYQPPRAFMSYKCRLDNDMNYNWRFADWYSLGAVAIWVCNPQRFWSMGPEHTDDMNVEEAYIDFTRKQVPILLAAACEVMHKADARTISRWIQRELAIVASV